MKNNRKFWLGILLVMGGAAILDYAIIKTPHITPHPRPDPTLTIPGFIIVAIGAYVIYQWKKQQLADRDQ